MLTYLNGEYLSSITTDADKIVSHTWSIGGVEWNNSDLAGQIKEEKAYQWNGKVGLISHSDYIRANSNQSMCGTAKINYENYKTCRDLDWMLYQDLIGGLCRLVLFMWTASSMSSAKAFSTTTVRTIPTASVLLYI